MPRERIAMQPDGAEVEVVWTPDPVSHVQVGVVQPSSQVMLLIGREELATFGAVVRDAVSDEASDADVALRVIGGMTEYRGLYTPGLSRDDCNDLIRQLRRARSAAFGRDE